MLSTRLIQKLHLYVPDKKLLILGFDFLLLKEMSIELSLEDVKRVAYHCGFEMEVSRCFS